MRSLFGYLFITLLMFTALNTFGESERDYDKIDNSIMIDRIVNNDIEVFVPSVIFAFKEVTIKLKFRNPEHTKLLLNNNKLHFIINGEDVELPFTDGIATFSHKFNDDTALSIYIEEFSFNKNITVFPLWAVLLPLILVVTWMIRRSTRKRKKNNFLIQK